MAWGGRAPEDEAMNTKTLNAARGATGLVAEACNVDRWSEGFGVIQHRSETVSVIKELLDRLEAEGAGRERVLSLLHAADRVTSAAMWLVVHATYARRVRLDGTPLEAGDFKKSPQGHTGGALNMVPAYVGYLLANALSGTTRGWMMGQGHCVAAIDAVNLLVGNAGMRHEQRFPVTDEGLSRYVLDHYGERIGETGEQESLGSHVGPHTAGGILEGGYLGFAQLQYVHHPLPGESLVAFLSDGAFEEQRGGDWAARWWRASDSGSALPVMIANGRRIDQRTTMAQEGGTDWLKRHLQLNGFDPRVFDGTDPAAFAVNLLSMERDLVAAGEIAEGCEARKPGTGYPVAMPYGIAETTKGYGFYGAGTNPAHNLPLPAVPAVDEHAARLFQEAAGRLHVPQEELMAACAVLADADRDRPRERDHPMVHRRPGFPLVSMPRERPVPADRRDRTLWTRSSPMEAVDEAFAKTVVAHPGLRARVGNPDEMRSNRLNMTLEALRFRVTDPEEGIPEAVDGRVIAALNEEAVVSAALGNKGGINLVHTYEAFGPKMLGALRQEVTFSVGQTDAGRPAGWLSVPVMLTSHTWENAKNEISHQDPTLAEAMMGEPSQTSRVVFPPDANSAAETLAACYRTRGQIWSVVASKAKSAADLFTREEAREMIRHGGALLAWAGHRPEDADTLLVACGACQLDEVLRASSRLAEHDWPHRVAYLYEPGRFRIPRTADEAAFVTADPFLENLFPAACHRRVFVAHTRPEPLLGVARRLDTGPRTTCALGFAGRGGTLSDRGLLFLNQATWAHVLQALASVGGPLETLSARESAALAGCASPHGVVIS